MRSRHLALSAVKLLIPLAFMLGTQICASEAATKCPSGQIRRVSLGICVPKAQNFAIVKQHARRSQPADAALEPAPARAREPSPEAARTERPDEAAPFEMATREMPAPADPPALSPAARVQAALSPFGQLFVGAFHSTLSSGLSAFR